MEQPEIYKSENELIKWLKSDLKTQRNELIRQGIKKEDIKKEDLTLNVGYKKNDISEDNKKIPIDFDFKFNSILQQIGCNEKDEKDKRICLYNINFRDVFFKDKADFSKVVFENETVFSYATFENEIVFSSSIFKASTTYFSGSTFNKVANFSGSTFKGRAYFFITVFNDEADFSHAIFADIAAFSFLTFNGKVDFSYSAFEYNANFSYVTVNNTIKFDNIKLTNNKSYIIFRNVYSGFKNSKIEIINTIVDGRIDFNDVRVGKVNFEGSNVISGGVVNRINFEAYPENSDTARFLKHEERVRSNTIKALKYDAIEKKLYTDELIGNKDNKKPVELIAERLSLSLSKLSNNHGQDWIRAVIFTLTSGLLFFSIADASLYNNNFFLLLLLLPVLLVTFCRHEKYRIIKYLSITILVLIILCLIYNKPVFIQNYFNYLIPINFDLMKHVNEKDLQPNYAWLISFYTFYILGKISIGYGIFEVIQAFRKFNIKH